MEKVLRTYHSQSGHTETMAKAVYVHSAGQSY